ncbi:MAG: nitroreductase [Chloroflexi bacterium]|nr:nitroreductase [Chloroflexota bacterium]MCI0804990.1 nitroreductase [Chloroflexota bacterium]MCI0852721.1 nitroreductase [Chloroflexota bacterium]
MIELIESGERGTESVLEAIRTRRNVREFTDKPVTVDDLKTIIEAATWAPNHRHTEPWRFIVLAKDGELRKQVAQIVHDWTYDNIKNPNQKRRIDSSAAAKREILDAPAFMYVYALEGPNEEVTRENYAATACAVQNLLLAAHSIGIGVGWSTGKPCLADVRSTIGAEPDWQTVGALYIGYPAEKPEAKRAPVDDVTTWR